MFTNPSIDSVSFQELRQICFKKHFIRLRLARDFNQYQSMGGNFAIYCNFSNTQLHSAETLQEIADFLRIGGVYD